jgi:hypothetical protein
MPHTISLSLSLSKAALTGPRRNMRLPILPMGAIRGGGELAVAVARVA